MSVPKQANELRVKIFADGAEKASMVELARDPLIKGFTTNPTLMRKAGVTDYAGFAKEVLAEIKDKPVSFEVFSDDFKEMERQARIINAWAKNVYVKIPVTNTKRESSADLIKKLASEGVKINATAILTVPQVRHIVAALNPKVPAVISVFAGRIADTGVDPLPIMKECKAITAANPNYELLWASPRQLLDIYNAEEAKCEIITVTPDILKKLGKVGYDHHELSLDTVKMFYDDGQKVGYTLYESQTNFQ
ncbi:MAG: transaldolase [Candidatus Liptonbacteria bacterium RIFCSPLOWO2_01_FULL_52_25]|uniref:Transaldolase n=1 Tax=Candidatus Liptonbacteria bacterium RIFCSPLOWO2_01_FULL_52_25 TaxID=1798650 RepID=A0A1G2CHL5_9BACT|nr:MAG: transaldolase [Candidatus Liptonbacteria bacterium RIFCSPLOWO2_01_FULL_52_25]